jgi:uncharacterized membrane protein YccF (DUF307 family)
MPLAPPPSVPTASSLAAPGSAVATATLNQNIIVSHRRNGPGMFSRALWFLFVGWWLTGFAIGFAWLCSLTIVLLPISFMIVNKIPTILTLRPRSVHTGVAVDLDGTIRINSGGARQRPCWQRVLWFLLVGWWACGLAMAAAYVLCLTVLLLPVGLMIFNRIPALMTLQRN